jgi:hypothetical protein
MAISFLCLQVVCQQRGPLAPPQDPVGESSPFRAITSIYGPAFERNVAKLAKFIKDNGLRHRAHAKTHKSSNIAILPDREGRGLRSDAGRNRETDNNPMRLTDTSAVSQATRCGAKTRSGPPCKSAPVTGRRRCRMHGGADGSGAPRGSKNGNYKHGRYTAEMAATRRWLREAAHMLRELNECPE